MATLNLLECWNAAQAQLLAHIKCQGAAKLLQYAINHRMGQDVCVEVKWNDKCPVEYTPSFEHYSIYIGYSEALYRLGGETEFRQLGDVDLVVRLKRHDMSFSIGCSIVSLEHDVPNISISGGQLTEPISEVKVDNIVHVI